MNKPITVKAHLSIEAIETRYRKAKDPVERSHWHIIWLLAQGKTTKEVAEVSGYCPIWGSGSKWTGSNVKGIKLLVKRM